MEYLPWVEDDEDEALAWIISKPAELEGDSYQIHEKSSIRAWWPDEVTFDLSPDYGVKVCDFIPTVLGLHIISEKLKKILESECGEGFDFYPVKIRNQKGRLVKKPYYLAHLRKIIAAMDWEQSDFDASSMSPDQALNIRKLVLDENKIPEGTKIFALHEQPDLWLVSYDLAVKIYRDEDCDGMAFIDIGDYWA